MRSILAALAAAGLLAGPAAAANFEVGRGALTMEEALERARESRGPDTITVLPGRYFLREPIRIGPDLDGLTIKGAGGGAAVLSGGRAINPDWKSLGSGARIARVRGEFNSLFLDAQRLMRARHPNQGSLPVGRGPEGLDKRWYLAPGGGDLSESWFPGPGPAEVVALTRYMAARQRVKRWTGLAIAVENRPHLEMKERFYLENVAGAVDAPGEWFLDRGHGELTMRPPNRRGTLIAGRLMNLVTIDGARDVTLTGVTFAHTDWRTDAQGAGAGYVGSQAAIYVTLPAAIEVRNADGATLRDIALRNTGGVGVRVSAATGTRILNSRFHDIGAGALVIGERPEGCLKADAACYRDLPALSPDRWAEGTVARGNVFRRSGRVFPDSAVITVIFSSRTAIVENDIAEAPYTGLSVGWRWTAGEPIATRGNTIEGNKITAVMQMLDDGAGVYMLGWQPGTRIVNNEIFDLVPDRRAKDHRHQIYGIYLDQGAREIEVRGNAIYATSPETASAHAPLFLHRAFDNVIERNLFADGQWGLLNFTAGGDRGRPVPMDGALGRPASGNVFRYNKVYGRHSKAIFNPNYGPPSISESDYNEFDPAHNLDWWRRTYGFDQNSTIGGDPRW